jgi:heptosyltransferase-3
MPGQPRNKILVIRGGAIGDFILTLPVLAAIRQQFPETRIEVLGYAHIAQLALIGGLADEVRSIEARALAGFFARRGDLDKKLQEYFGQFAVIVSYLYDPDEIFRENIGRCSKAQFIAGPHRPEEAANIHASRAFLRPLEQLAIFDADPVPRLKLEGMKRERPTLALHPGSGSEKKNWPEHNWAELMARLLEDSDWELLLVGGEAEEGRIQRLAKRLPSARVEIAHSLALPDLARRLSQCRGFVGHDSGITHLAAAVGLPVLVLWGTTREETWRPIGERVALSRGGEGLEKLSVDTVWAELERLIKD